MDFEKGCLAYRCLERLLDRYNLSPSFFFSEKEIQNILDGEYVYAENAFTRLIKLIDDTIEKENRNDERAWEYELISKIEENTIDESDACDLIVEWVRKTKMK